jgi:hypothetical protein
MPISRMATGTDSPIARTPATSPQKVRIFLTTLPAEDAVGHRHLWQRCDLGPSGQAA